MRREEGAGGVLIIAVLALVAIGIVAVNLFTRLGDESGDEAAAAAALQKLANGLDAFGASALRLPCPAKPDDTTGREVIKAGSPGKCEYDEGTIPWATIGARASDAVDPWGRKVSYRVYTGNAGSLTQPGGISMVMCDTDGTGSATSVSNGIGGLCDPSANVYARNTPPAAFVAGKGFTVNLKGGGTTTQDTDVAYVLISHGSTGLGGYTVSGARLEMPKKDELDNTKAAGDFTIAPHSDNDVEATSNSHFDDLLVYRRLGDLVKNAGLGARDWPELPMGTSSVLFSRTNVSNSAGSPVTTGAGVGNSSLTFPGGVTVTGRDSSGNASEITFGETLLTLGLVGGVGVSGGGSYLIQSSAGEYVRLQLTSGATKFGITLNDFGSYGLLPTFSERMQLRFFLDDTQVGTYTGTSCNIDGSLGSFTVDVGQVFNRVEVAAIPSTNTLNSTQGNSSFFIAEVKACGSGESVCRTTLDNNPLAILYRCS